ncbi:MAG: PorP/SprF family type IX secretion system membrane protein [Chitinophagales bacterium]|nr:PorP/SprF family type IX secretion system membrane protein [Chitinophagales bacterium]
MRKGNLQWKKWLLLVAVLMCFLRLDAQDPAFSQFFAQRIYLNPANSGSESGLNVSVIYRYQWREIPGGFTTYGFSSDIRSTRLSSALGVYAWQTREAKIFTTTQVGGSYSYIIKLSKMVNWHIGIGGSYVNKHVDASKLLFSDQLDPEDGVTGGTSAQLITDKVNYFDLDAGTLLKFGWKYNNLLFHNAVGFAVHHLTQPNNSFINLETDLPIRYTVHYGGMFPMNFNNKKKKTEFYLSPVFKFDYQAGLKEFNYGFFNSYDPIYFGVFYKHNSFFNQKSTKTLIFTGGYSGYIGEGVNYILGYSYDFNLTGVGTKAKGVHEITLRMRFPEIELLNKPLNSKSYKPQKCYDFGGKNTIKLF